MMNCKREKGSCKTKCIKIGLLAVAGVAALGGVVMLLWNWLIPSLFFGAQPVSYCQALGVLVLSKILFGGFRGHCHGRWHERRQQWERMTPEEREKLKGRFGSRWSKCCSTDEPKDGANPVEK
jgi:hypothetical protein